ncbi:MAG: SDR family oxidoreductase [Saprospiraceae bacterium]|nr:SDR family oxidoreductase [Saprospiraceae bacterium]
MQEKGRFADHRVLITGGGRGIGRAIAKAFAGEGALVAINYRSDQQEAEACLKALPGTGHIAIKADIGQPAAAMTLVEQTVKEFGRIDVLVNNAGIHAYHPIDSTSYEADCELDETSAKALRLALRPECGMKDLPS